MYKSKKILILDDDKIFTSSLKTFFSLEGFTDTHFFNSPFEAVDFLQNNCPDLIISDFVMPEMNGLEFLKKAKSLYPDTCMILLTGYADKENAVRAINEVGLYKYIEKPLDDKDDLLINIKNGIERSNLISSLKEKVATLDKVNKELEKYSNQLEDMVKARTAELSESNSKLNAVISNCADGIVLINENGTLESVNNSAETMFGLSEAMVKNIKTDDLFVLEKGKFSEKFKKFRNSGILENVTVKNAVNGNDIVADISYAKIEPLNYYVFVIRDMSVQKEAQKLREDFIATLTHDLRTPLLAAIQTLKFFTDGSLGELTEKQNMVLTTMLQSNKDMLGLVNALLEVYKYESGTIPITKSLFNPNDLINQCCEEISSLAQSKNIELIRELDETNDTEINADRNEIRRVVMNLLGNAVNYTAENGKILVKSSLNGNDYMFSVKDNGVGIAHDDINKMFKRYSQVTKNRRSASTGLGLYLSKQIIEAHGGKIWLESIQNKGSEFFFLLLDAVAQKNRV